jgi:hypothetical protein
MKAIKKTKKRVHAAMDSSDSVLPVRDKVFCDVGFLEHF